MAKYPYAGIILAGGLNKRMAGKNKALLTVGDFAIVERQIRIFQELFEQVIVVTNHLLDLAAWGVTLVSDLIPMRSSLTGIHAGLFYTRPSHAFISACDMPFLKREMIELLFQHFEQRWDVVVPLTREGYQPLCAIYSRRCLKPIEEQVGQGDLKISKLFSRSKIKEIPEDSLRRIDPDLISFFNINTVEDLSRSQELISHG
ncbi:MAG TPA: molybdenum cofactor guanylyltransferase [Thermodesulfobacteriota bacterium]|nr:molybdenum cofactor guanylyltransferase [Thermodesulfobacteriota bacterium]